MAAKSDDEFRRILRSIILKKNDCLSSKEFPTFLSSCRKNQAVLRTTGDVLFSYLKSGSVARRTNAVLVINELFLRSHIFRLYVVHRFKDLLRLTLETDPMYHPLPGPADAAKDLKTRAFKIFMAWYEKYGKLYGQLQLAYDYIKKRLSVDFNNFTLSSRIEAKKEQETAERKQRLERNALEKVEKEFSNLESDIRWCLSSADSAIRLLVPLVEESAVLTGDPSVAPTSAGAAVPEQLSTSGSAVTVAINVEKLTLRLTEDNADLVASLRDAYKLMVKSYEPTLNRWLKTAGRTGGSLALMRRLSQLSSELSSLKRKIEELNITAPAKQTRGGDSSDDEFEEVGEKEGVELDWKPPDYLPSYLLNGLAETWQAPSSSPSSSTRAGTPQAVPSSLPAAESSSVPVVPYGLDLKYWNKKNVEASLRTYNDYDCHRFWRPAEPDEGPCQDEDVALYRERVMEFTGIFEPVLHQCRAPLKNGKLCPRRDRLKCPLHGLIIPRDECGHPVNPYGPNASGSTGKRKQGSSIDSAAAPDSDEAAFLRDLSAGTGLDFVKSAATSKVSHNRSSGREVRDAIRRKVLNRSSLKRVGMQSDSLQYNRNFNRFRDHWNYY